MYNNYAIISGGDDYSLSVAKSYYSLVQEVGRRVHGKWTVRRETRNLYEIDKKTGDLLLPRGLADLTPSEYTDIVNREINTLDKNNLEDMSDDLIAKILQPESGFDLRSDQVIAVRKAYLVKRGILQLATGAGKTEIMSATLKLMNHMYGYYPKTLIIEPTLHLVHDTVKRLKKYNIPVSAYTSHRDINHSEVILTHPMSLSNDILKDPSLLNDVKVIFYDEAHHLRSSTWFNLMKSLSSVEYSIALSASIIDPKKIGVTDLKEYTVGEALAIGGSGRLLLNIPPSYYIKQGILATPVVLQLNNPANEPCTNPLNWSEKVKNRLESPYRTQLAATTASIFDKYSRKTLIFASTKTNAKKLMKMLFDLGVSCRCSFGGGSYLKWDPDQNKAVGVNSAEDTMEMFKQGIFRVLIATSHLLEGADVPNLDCIVVLDGGKKLRKMIQEIGRGIRKTKTGKYAYIIDFTDHEDTVLERHASKRLSMYREVIQVPENLINEDLTIQQLESVFLQLEDL
ncbi:ATP-dependent helicase [Listeria phage LIS04]|nr:ATP-dependent helicase [Listeria phage LIS04]